MRRFLPLALLLVACTKPAPVPVVAPAPPKPVAVDLTPEGMAKAMDVPLYPGAEAPDGLSVAPVRSKDGSTRYSLVLATKDPVDKAATWYADRLRSTAPKFQGGRSIFAQSPKGNDLQIVVAPEAGRTLIRIKSMAYQK